MNVTPIRVDVVHPGDVTLLDLIDGALTEFAEGSILVITSKIIALCEERVVPMDGADREQLIKQESTLYLPSEISKYAHHFTIAGNTLIAAAGIDGSNGDDNYVLWPADSQAAANMVRAHLVERFGVECCGVLVTDSTSQPLRMGTTGIALAHSGFRALHEYIGEPDLFGKPQLLTKANISGGLAAAAVVAMGEGNEQTPLCLLRDLPFVEFQGRNPNDQELADIHVTLEDDLFAPFLQSAAWRKGDKS